MARAEEMKRYLWRAIAIIIGGLFIYAGAVKVIDPAEFSARYRQLQDAALAGECLDGVVSAVAGNSFRGLALIGRSSFIAAAFLFSRL
jgi:hypothetical protein